MPNFDCGGGGCRSWSCASCTDEATRDEYWKVLQSCRSDIDADRIMRERLAKRRKAGGSLEARIAALETAVASLTEWRERRDREDR